MNIYIIKLYNVILTSTNLAAVFLVLSDQLTTRTFEFGAGYPATLHCVSTLKMATAAESNNY